MSTAASSVVERMRKLREEKLAAAAAAAAAAASTSASAAPASPPSAVAASLPGSAVNGSEASPTPLKEAPPAFISPPSSVLRFRDYAKDPLCGSFSALAAAQLLERLAVSEVTELEEEEQGGGGGDRGPGLKRRREDSEGNNAPTVSDNAVAYFEREYLRRRSCGGAAKRLVATDCNSCPDLYSDVAYAERCATATMDVAGAPRIACRDAGVYALKKRIAQGVYGIVWSAVAAGASKSRSAGEQGRLYALKCTKREWLEESEVGFPPYLLREFDLLLRMHHPNLVAVREIVALDPNTERKEGTTLEGDSQGRDGRGTSTAAAAVTASPIHQRKARDVYVVMEHCPLDLHQYMCRYCRDTGASFLHVSSRNTHPAARDNFLARVKCIALQMLRGVNFLHDHRIIHRDIKTSNVLLSREGYVKLCDFGLGRHYKEGEALTPTVVTLMYRAPELHFGVAAYSHAIDVWSIGCIIAELFLKRPLFKASEEAGHLLAVCDIVGIPSEETFPGVFKMPKAREMLRAMGRWNREDKLAQVFQNSPYVDAQLLPASGLDLLSKMFQWCPAERISAEEALHHPFFREAPLPCAPGELMRPMPSSPMPVTAVAPSKSAREAPPIAETQKRRADNSAIPEGPIAVDTADPARLHPAHAAAAATGESGSVGGSASAVAADAGDATAERQDQFMSPDIGSLRPGKGSDDSVSLRTTSSIDAEHDAEVEASRLKYVSRMREEEDTGETGGYSGSV